MPTDFSDHLTVAGAPSAWGARRLVFDLLEALRGAGFVPKKNRIVVSVTFVGAAEMTRLNSRYRGKRRPTDVLSFEQQGAKAPRGLTFLGDLVLCVPVVRAQAQAEGHGVRQELAVLVAHGLLHLLGYDHERSAREDRRMFAAEEKLLKKVGLGSAGLIRRNKVLDRS